MKKALFTILFLAQLILINGYAQTTNQFKPAVFADENRKAKLQAAMPLVEDLYKEYATKHHFPAYAFAIYFSIFIICFATFNSVCIP